MAPAVNCPVCGVRTFKIQPGRCYCYNDGCAMYDSDWIIPEQAQAHQAFGRFLRSMGRAARWFRRDTPGRQVPSGSP